MPQLRRRRSESGGACTGIAMVAGMAGAAAEWSGAIWVYFGLQVCFSKISTPTDRATWGRANRWQQSSHSHTG